MAPNVRGAAAAALLLLAPAAGAQTGALTYTPSPARRQANVERFAAAARAVDPQAAARLSAAFGAGDGFARLQAAIARYGLRTDDVGDAYATYWVRAWQAARGAAGDPPAATVRAVARQVASVLGAVPAVANASDSARQALAESALMEATLLSAMVDRARGDRDLLARAAAAARRGAKARGLDLDVMTLTTSGFGRGAPRQPADVAEGAVGPAAAPAEAPATAAAEPRPGGSAVAGLPGIWRADWVENEYQAFTGLTLVAKDVTLILTPDGYFMRGIPNGTGLDGAAAQTLMRTQPKRAGRYEVRGSLLELIAASGERDTATVRRSGSGVGVTYRNRPLSRKSTFPDGARLDGIYTQQRITQAGGTFVVGAGDIRFTRDGRFEAGDATSFTSEAATGIGGRRQQTGRYTIQGGALRLTFDDGRQAVRSVFYETPGQAIWLNDAMWTPRK